MKIISITERKDGSADMTYQLHKEDVILFKKIAKNLKVKFTNKFCNKLILQAINNFIKEEK